MTREEHEKEIYHAKCCKTCAHYSMITCEVRTYISLNAERQPETVTITRDNGDTFRDVVYVNIGPVEHEIRMVVDDGMVCARWEMSSEYDANGFIGAQS